MSPTFIRLKHFVLASLIAVAAIHPSSSIAAAAPTPAPLTNELLSRESLLPHINSDFGLSVPMLRPTLIRRNNDEDNIHSINAEWNKFCEWAKKPKRKKQRVGILVSQTKHLYEILHPAPGHPRPSIVLENTAREALDNYFSFIVHPSFEDSELMDEISTMNLQVVLAQFGVLDPNELHDPRLSHVVLYWLKRGDINIYCRDTTQVFALANDVITLLEHSKSSEPHIIPEHPDFKPTDNLSDYHKLLTEQHYIPWPQEGNIETIIEKLEKSWPATDQNEQTARSQYITAILLRYTRWKRSRDMTMELGALVTHFNNELTRPIPPEAKIVIKAYLWVLTGSVP
ncbi:hypothetical protein H0H93_012735 [Arthromyces matolae]|nr:hypothetical protein H0H93_012735 [Arthromyces matolae]